MKLIYIQGGLANHLIVLSRLRLLSTEKLFVLNPPKEFRYFDKLATYDIHCIGVRLGATPRRVFYLCIRGLTFVGIVKSYRTNDFYDQTNRYNSLEYLQSVFSFEVPRRLLSDVKLHRKKNDIDYMIVVHARRGDYERWLDGTYCFGHDYYLSLLKVLQRSGYTPVLCTDDQYLREVACDYVVSHDYGVFGDFYILSLADCIYCPPSTFSAWSNVYKEKKMFYLISDSKPPQQVDRFLEKWFSSDLLTAIYEN